MVFATESPESSFETVVVAVRISGSGGIPMAVGKVKWFNDEKGWGFIKQDNGPDVFVHYSQISGEGRRRLFEDELVEFEIKEGPKGLQAINVIRQNPAMGA
jgi:cold shock protein